jgi:hypothetical protein
MNTLVKYFFLLSFITSFSQNNEQETDSIGKDILDASYFLKNNTVYKKTTQKTFSYQNFALGNVSTVDILNSQEVVVFYKDFNSVVILDNQLNEIDKITFQDTILFARKGIANKIWLFNADNNKIDLYDYKSNTISLSSQIITDFKPLNMESGFNYVKLKGKNKTLIFDQYLNLTESKIQQKNH